MHAPGRRTVVLRLWFLKVVTVGIRDSVGMLSLALEGSVCELVVASRLGAG